MKSEWGGEMFFYISFICQQYICITPTKKKNETRKKNIKIVLLLKISREEPIFIARPFQALGARNLVV